MRIKDRLDAVVYQYRVLWQGTKMPNMILLNPRDYTALSNALKLKEPKVIQDMRVIRSEDVNKGEIIVY